jgi:hypothetical protein
MFARRTGRCQEKGERKNTLLAASAADAIAKGALLFAAAHSTREKGAEHPQPISHAGPVPTLCYSDI